MREWRGGLKERMGLNNFLPLKSREGIRKRGLSRGLTLFQCKLYSDNGKC